MSLLRLLKAQRMEIEGLFAVLVLLILFAYQSTAISLYQLWSNDNNPTYSHGLLLLLVSSYIFIKRWQSLKAHLSLSHNLMAALLVLTASLLWMLAEAGNVQVAAQLVLLSLFLLLIYALYGRAVALRLAFPVLLMLCALPIWDVFTTFLRQVAVISVTFMLDLSGFLAVSEEYNILVPAGIFKVDTGCSGLNQFIVACVIGLLYGNTRKLDMMSSTFVVGLAILFAILANIVRIYIVVVAGQLTNMQHYFVVGEHVTLGWVVFSVLMFIYFFLLESKRLKKYLPLSTQGETQAPNVQNGDPGNRGKKFVQMSLVAASLVAGPAYLVLLSSQSSMPVAEVEQTLEMPSSLGNWRLSQETLSNNFQLQWQPDIVGEDIYRRSKYFNAQSTIELHLYHYILQKQGKEAVYDRNRIGNEYWHQQSVIWTDVVLEDRQFSLKETQIESSNGGHKLVWDWYYVNGARVSSPYKAKMLNIWGILTGRPLITHYVVAIDKQSSGHQSQRHALEGFLSKAIPLVEDLVAKTKR